MLFAFPYAKHTLFMVLSWVGVTLIVSLFVEAQRHFSIGGGGNAELVKTTDGVGRLSKTKTHAHLEHISCHIIFFVIVKTGGGGV